MDHTPETPRDNMYEVVFPVPDVTGSEDDRLTLVIAMQGYADAGHAVSNTADYLLEALDNCSLVNFNADELIDYRSRRPAVTMRGNEITDLTEVDLSLKVLRDNDGKPFLLLSGPEPDLRWNAFSRAVADLVERYDVGRTISLYSAPMTVPHTRPMGIIAHSNDPEVLSQARTWSQRVTVPGAASLLIEFELSSRGRSATGFTAQVPHYIAHSEYPLAALRLLQKVAEIAHLELPLEALEREAERVAQMLAKQTVDSAEVAQVVNMLEQQYDEEERQREMLESSPLLGPDGTMPSADEIGAEFERFLASQINAAEASDPDTVEHEPADSPDSGDTVTSANSDLTDVESDESDETIADATSTSTAGADAADDAENQQHGLRETDATAAPEEPSESESSETAEPKKPHRRGWRPWFRF